MLSASRLRTAKSNCRSSCDTTIWPPDPLAKWAMLMAGNYRCITEDGMRTAKEAVHTVILEASRSIYDFVIEVCTKIGASKDELVPFEKYAAAANDLSRPASAARALTNGAVNIERADKLVQLVASQNGMRHARPGADRGTRGSAAGREPQGQTVGGVTGLAAVARRLFVGQSA